MGIIDVEGLKVCFGGIKGWSRNSRVSFMDWQQTLSVGRCGSTIKIDHVLDGSSTNTRSIFVVGVQGQVAVRTCGIVGQWKCGAEVTGVGVYIIKRHKSWRAKRHSVIGQCRSR